jgi:hypothetical protein
MKVRKTQITSSSMEGREPKFASMDNTHKHPHRDLDAQIEQASGALRAGFAKRKK